MGPRGVSRGSNTRRGVHTASSSSSSSYQFDRPLGETTGALGLTGNTWVGQQLFVAISSSIIRSEYSGIANSSIDQAPGRRERGDSVDPPIYVQSENHLGITNTHGAEFIGAWKGINY